MEEPVHPLTDQTRFVRELLALYKDYPVLWDKNHPHYRSRAERSEAIDVLLQKCKEFYPEADEDFVKLKIDSLRACFRKEWNKVCLSKASAERPEDIHKPSLWYYNLLLYTVGEECSEDEFKSQDTSVIYNYSIRHLNVMILYHLINLSVFLVISVYFILEGAILEQGIHHSTDKFIEKTTLFV